MRTLDRNTHEPATGLVALLGVPWDEKSSHARGSAAAPPHVRSYVASGASNFSTEHLLDLTMIERFVDAGDLVLPEGNDAMDVITQEVDTLIKRGARVLAIGGDHANAYPLIRAAARHHQPLNVLQIDAHPDLYDELDGDRYSHACPFARLMEDGLITRLVQLGIRANTPHQAEQARRFGVEQIDMQMWAAGNVDLNFDGPVYVSLDVDGIDPSHAPAVAHPEAGGLHAREVITLIQQLPSTIIGADIVELIPARDINDTTTSLVWKLIKELAARMLDINDPPDHRTSDMSET